MYAILVVDDALDIGEMLRVALNTNGSSCRIEQATTIPNVWKYLDNGGGEKFHLILMDAHLGGSTYTFGLVRQIRQRGIAVPIGAISADPLCQKQLIISDCTGNIIPLRKDNLIHEVELFFTTLT